MSYRYLNFLLLSLLFFASCENRPKDVLSASEMAEVLADLNRAEALFELERFQGKVNSEEQYCYRLGILEKHNTNRAQLDSSIVWYNRDPKKLDKVFYRVVQMLEEEKKQIEANPITRRGSSKLKKENKDFVWYMNYLDQLKSPDEFGFNIKKYSIEASSDSLLQVYGLVSSTSSSFKHRYAKEMRTWSMSDLSDYYLSRGTYCDYEKIPLVQWCEGVFRSYKDEPLVFEGRLDSVMLRKLLEPIVLDSLNDESPKEN